jgi:transposase-like protein
MSRPSKFTVEQKYEIALDLISGKHSHAGVCRKWSISSTYAYKLKDRALELLRGGMGHPLVKPDAKVEQLEKKVADLEELAGDQALAIRIFKKNIRQGR